jgi:hypothetical protein
MTDDKKIKIYTKDAFVFSGKLIEMNPDFVTVLDFKTNKNITIPILNTARIEEVKE